MEYRTLGRTGLSVGVIGLGTEYLRRKPQQTVVEVIQKALENGVNYIDLVFTFPEYLDNICAALKGHRDDVILACHLGSAERKGQYRKTRSVKECKKVFLDTLARLKTSYSDIVNIHFVRNRKEYEDILSKGIMDLAFQLKDEGKARFVGMSTHDVSVAAEAAQRGIDVIVIQVNLANNALPGRNEMLSTCYRKGVGVVAMKPFAAGKLFRKNRTVTISTYQTGGKSLKKKIPRLITPVQCISYTLSQVGVCTLVPGFMSTEELEAALRYLKATKEERDFSQLMGDFKEYIEGECLYCNHCLPCPSNIDIGQVIRLSDIGMDGVTPSLKESYSRLDAKASDCIECGACTERCPFGVDVTAKMKQIKALFEI